jgi:hypothetical protein
MNRCHTRMMSSDNSKGFTIVDKDGAAHLKLDRRARMRRA